MDISEYKKLMKAASEGKTTASENESDGEQHERPISSLVKNTLGAISARLGMRGETLV